MPSTSALEIITNAFDTCGIVAPGQTLQPAQALGAFCQKRRLPPDACPCVGLSLAAAELGLVPNTASTLVSKLVSNGLLVRTACETDRRVGRLRLAEPTQQIVDAARATRRALLAEVLGELDHDQIEALTRGLEALDTMTRILQERRS